MGYLPGFKNDIFISYRHASNEGQDKWVDAFCDALRASLTELVGDIAIWRDNSELRAGDFWRPEIQEALNNAAIFLAIISRTYFDSEICQKEFDLFLGRLKDQVRGLSVRIVPIFKQPTKPEQELPPELAETHHIDFFQFEPPGSQHFREFAPGMDEESKYRFLETCGRLAQDLMHIFDDLKGNARKLALGTVYLARVGPELREQREKLRSDLQQRGYLVIPEREYFWSSNFGEKIAADVDQADLCIHQISRTASIEAQTSERAKIQLELATEAMKKKGKPLPLVWIQPAQDTDTSARALIDYIEQDLSNKGVEYCQDSLENFKTQIYDKLPRRAPPPKADATGREVALIVEESDLYAARELMEILANQSGVEPRRVKFAGLSAKEPPLSRTLDRFKRCIIFWGSRPEEWVSDMLEIEELSSFCGKERLCVYAAPPISDDKKSFITRRARLVYAVQRDLETQLREFLGNAEPAP